MGGGGGGAFGRYEGGLALCLCFLRVERGLGINSRQRHGTPSSRRGGGEGTKTGGSINIPVADFLQGYLTYFYSVRFSWTVSRNDPRDGNPLKTRGGKGKVGAREGKGGQSRGGSFPMAL